ncbi:hypothetical protein GPJ56_001578 [Histomonas meleagridis]|uniref:uncharacterized protein n=1 Tax=Histomonas meleagridis TaxID=135588 RepID=UPI00355AA856|nr:hypothetical protein GPJ56_001578 [Histomonas meleagridis]KAH0807084.1 hypothetical protein GO595_000260 [Histomonas meleagridis]
MVLTRYNTTSSYTLRSTMDEILIKQFAAVKIYRSRLLTILIGLLKIINAVALLLLYAWHVDWERKLPICIFFVILSCGVYAFEFLLSTVWWPNFIGLFSKENSNQKFIVCSGTPFYSGKYQIKIYQTQSGSYFQRLPEPVVDQTFEFTDYFTKSGYMIESEWRHKCDELIKKAQIHSHAN